MGPVYVILLACACGGSGPTPGHTLADIRQRGEITWGADLSGGEPYVYEDPAHPNQLVGFEVDIMDAIARRLGVKARMVQYNWSNLVQSLERGDFDIVMNGLEATQERKDRILLSDPYYVYAETLAVRADSDVRSIFELGGKRVGTLNQTFAHDILRMMPTIRPVLYEGNEEPYIDLEQGRSDAVLLDNIIADRYGCTDKHPRIKCVPYDVARGIYVVGMRRGDDELKAAIDGALRAMREDGELEKILRKANIWDDRQLTAAALGRADSRKRAFDLEMVGQFAWSATVTLELTVLAFLIAVPLGALLAIMRVYGGFGTRAIARGYIELFRGTPVLLQLFVLYYGISDFIHLGAVQAAVLGLGLNYGAYEAEVYRGALLAIPRGQTEAAKALGMRPVQILRHVLLPQALRHALPPMTNDFVSLLKDSSLVSVITVIELTKQMQIAAADLRSWLLPGLACAALYLALSLPLSELARLLERRLGGDHRPHAL
jgi:polar amino acid transport system permease protein/polar amino acid transport system substrate-binding protein